jgi:hypothetical protein
MRNLPVRHDQAISLGGAERLLEEGHSLLGVIYNNVWRPSVGTITHTSGAATQDFTSIGLQVDERGQRCSKG